MVVNHIHVVGVIFLPTENDPPLIVDSQAPEALKISAQFLELVAGRRSENVRGRRGVDLVQQPPDFVMQFLVKLARVFAVEAVIDIPRGFASETYDHISHYTRYRYKYEDEISNGGINLR